MDQQLSYANSLNFTLADQIVKLYSTENDAEREQIMQTLKPLGKDSLLSELQCQPLFSQK